MKAIRIFRRNIANAFKSIFRNISLSIASIICTTITLIIVAIASIIFTNIDNFTHNIEDTLTILVFVNADAKEDEVSTVKSRILEIKNIKSDEIIYKDKETIRLETLKNSTEGSAIYNIMNNLEEKDNFLETEFILSVNDVTEIKNTVESLKKIDNVTNVKYSEDVIDNMLPVFNVIEKIMWVIIIGLVIVTMFLITNTIKLTIFARRSEIEIIRLVGTSNFVIKLPFVIEGLFLGIIGSIIPIIATIWGYIMAYDKLEGYLFTNFIKMIEPLPFVLYISGVLIVIGSIVGMAGSYSAVRKYLKI